MLKIEQQSITGHTTWRNIKDLVRLHKPSLFILFETHAPYSHVEKKWESEGTQVGYGCFLLGSLINNNKLLHSDCVEGMLSGLVL